MLGQLYYASTETGYTSALGFCSRDSLSPLPTPPHLPIPAGPQSSATGRASPAPSLPPSTSSISAQIPSPPTQQLGAGQQALGTHLGHCLANSFWAGLLPGPPSHTHHGAAASPAVQPPPASCPWQPARPCPALRPFGGRTVSTWSAHLRTAAADAGLSCHPRRTSSPLPGPPCSPSHPIPPACLAPRAKAPAHKLSLNAHGSPKFLQTPCGW